MRVALSDLAIRRLNPPEQGQAKYRDTVLPGFGVIVGQRTKTFFITVGKKRRNVTVGRYPDMNLATARREAIRLMTDTPGKHQIERLPQLADAYLTDCRLRLRPKSVLAYETILKHAPDILISKVDKTTVKVGTAHEVKAYKAMFNWAMQEEICGKNPFAHMTARFGQRDRVLSVDEIRAVWEYCHEPYTTIVKLLLLTGQRRGQIWRYDPAWLKGDLISFPPDAMKSGRSHQIPVGSLTRSLLPSTPFDFNGWSKAQVRLHKHVGFSDFTLHDLRRTFATLHASIGTPIHVIEAQLDHSSGTISGVAAIYNRYNYIEEMRAAVTAYETHLASLIAS